MCSPNTTGTTNSLLCFLYLFGSWTQSSNYCTVINLDCFELELGSYYFGLYSCLCCDLAFVLTIVVHFVALGSPALNGFVWKMPISCLLSFSSTISAFRAAISLLSSVATALLKDREQGMQTWRIHSQIDSVLQHSSSEARLYKWRSLVCIP